MHGVIDRYKVKVAIMRHISIIVNDATIAFRPEMKFGM